MTKILIVEDEEALSDPLAFLLGREGFQTVVVDNGLDALPTFEREGADLVLLDVMLPGMPGTEVCRKLREVSSVPIIMLTAKDSELDKVFGLELGADDYVTKPYSARELIARIRAVLRRRSAEPDMPMDAVLTGGPVRNGHRSPRGDGQRRGSTHAAEGIRAAGDSAAQRWSRDDARTAD